MFLESSHILHVTANNTQHFTMTDKQILHTLPRQQNNEQQCDIVTDKTLGCRKDLIEQAFLGNENFFTEKIVCYHNNI